MFWLSVLLVLAQQVQSLNVYLSSTIYAQQAQQIPIASGLYDSWTNRVWIQLQP